MEKFELLIDHIYRLWVPFEIDRTSVFLIRTDEGDILFDAATTAADVNERILPALAEIGSVPVCLVMSHDHSDHAGGLPYVAAALPKAALHMVEPEGLHLSLAARVRRVKDGDQLGTGTTVWQMPGHTAEMAGLYDAAS